MKDIITERMREKNNFIIRYTVLFGGIVLLGFSPFFLSNRSLVWATDAVGQYYPAFIYIGQWLQEALQNILHGNFTVPFFDLSIGMGEDIIGCLNYYGFGDPVNLLAVFVTEQNSAYLYTALYFLRLYLAGIAFYKYCDYMDLNRSYINMGVLCYLFYGYTLSGGSRYIQFLSPLIYFPLILLGCEKIFREQKSRILTFSVAYAALCNFYFLYMVSLALAVYCAVRLISRYGVYGYQEIIKKCLCCIGQYLLGIALSAPILLPSLTAFFGSLRTGVSPWDILFDIDNWMPAMYKEFLIGVGGRIDTLYWAEIPILEMLALAAVFFLPRTKRNMQCMLAVLGGIAVWCIPVVGYILNGFGVQTYTRWVFMLQLGFCIVLICVLSEAETWLQKRKRAGWFRGAVYIFMTANIVLNVYWLNAECGLNWSSEFLKYEEVGKYVDSPVCYADVIAEDKGVYRISNDQLTGINGRPENVAMINDYHGLTFWFSLVNGNTQEMINQLATKNWYNWRSYGLNNSPEYETLAGVKYYFQKDGQTIPLGYEKVDTLSFYGDAWNVYENTNAVPLGCVYHSAVSAEQFDALDDIQKMGVGLEHIVLESDTLETDYVEYTERDMPYELQTPEYELTEKGLQISYELAKDSQAYLYIKEDDLNNQITISSLVDGQEKEYQCSDNRGFLHNLGGFQEEEMFLLNVDFSEMQDGASAEDIMPIEDLQELKENIQVWILKEEMLQEATGKLRLSGMTDITLSDNCIAGNIGTEEDGYLLLAVPYHKNWKAYVDGTEVQVHKANTMYMSVVVAEGEHEIVFCYDPIEVKVGMVLAVVALVGMVGWKRKYIYFNIMKTK